MAKTRVTKSTKKAKAATVKRSAGKSPKKAVAGKSPKKAVAGKAAAKKRAGAMAVGTPGTEAEARAYLASLAEPRRSELSALDALIRETVPGLRPFSQSGMLAYGPYHYKYASGREGDWFRVGLSSRAQYISLYCCATAGGKYVAEGFKSRLPKADIGKSCVRFKRLGDVDVGVLRELLRATEAGGFGM